MASIPTATFYGKIAAASTYKYREIPNDSSDSELSNNEISEPATGQQKPVTLLSDSSGSDDDPEDNVLLANFQTQKLKNLTKKMEKSTILRSNQNVEFLGSD